MSENEAQLTAEQRAQHIAQLLKQAQVVTDMAVDISENEPPAKLFTE